VYTPSQFAETRPDVIAALIRANPLATIVGHTVAGLEANHIPLMLQELAGAPGKLIGHVARANPLWQHPPGDDLLVIFQGPAAYISPNWYATKAEGGKVVPTWNYAVVHARCSLKALTAPAEVLGIITALTNTHEAGSKHPWQVADAPPDYTEKLLAAIVGIELTIKHVTGKWKVSQNQPVKNRESVVAGLNGVGTQDAAAMAALVAARAGG
jgi:transcriptional regulator